jgi:hypothetical protein
MAISTIAKKLIISEITSTLLLQRDNNTSNPCYLPQFMAAHVTEMQLYG